MVFRDASVQNSIVSEVPTTMLLMKKEKENVSLETIQMEKKSPR